MYISRDALLREGPIAATTNGWDTVYGIKFDDVNQAILNDTEYTPGNFDIMDPEAGSELRMFGDFQKWQVNGGSGHLLTMALPADDFTLENYPSSGSADVVKANPVFSIEVELELIDHEGPGALRQGEGETKALKLRMPGSNAMPATIVTLDLTWDGYDEDNLNDRTIRAIAMSLMNEWLSDANNVARFGHTFATVNLNQRVADAEDSKLEWLNPSYVAYGVTSTMAEDGTVDGVLALLCMGQGRKDQAPTNRSVSPELVPEGTRSGFLISKERFLRKMLLPGLGQTFANDADKKFPQWIEKNFEVTGNGTRIENKCKLTINKFDIGAEGKPDLVEASLPARGVQIVMNDASLTVRYAGLQHYYGKNVTGWMTNVTHQIAVEMHAGVDDNKFVLVPGAPGEGENEKTLVTHTASLEKTEAAKIIDWVIIGLDALTIVFSFAAAIKGFRAGKAVVDVAGNSASLAGRTAAAGTRAGSVTANRSLSVGARGVYGNLNPAVRTAAPVAARTFPWKTIAEVWGGLLLSVSSIELVRSILQDQASQDGTAAASIPNVNDLAKRVMAPVQWPNATGFDVDTVQFNGGFQIIGNPTFADAPVPGAES